MLLACDGETGSETVASMVKVRLLSIGMSGSLIPAPCMSVMLRVAGQVAPPAAVQASPLTLTLSVAGSVNTAPLSGWPVVLVMTTV